MKPSLTLGCGSWGGNSVSENVGVKHLINVKTVAERRENMLWFRAPEKVYFKKGSTPVALDELGTVMGKKRAFIVTDQFLFKNGNTRAIEAKLDEMGIAHDCFYDVEPDPSLQCARRGAKQMALFEPDVIIAVGGGSAMDAGKIMWMMYEHPECKFEDMAMDFMDIRKRIFTFPEMGKKAYFVASRPLRYRLRVHAVRHHHRQGDRHQVAARRLRAAPQHGYRRRRQLHDRPARPDRCLRHRRHDPRHRVLCLHHGFRLHQGPLRARCQARL